ncbi:MAG TPA: hypothetical protein VJA66_01065 [Thermoanaerobaculia bacterium]
MAIAVRFPDLSYWKAQVKCQTGTSASLVQLVLFVAPLTSLVNGVIALSPDRGAAELLLSQPVPRRTIPFGPLLGLFAGLAAAQAAGLGAAGLVIFWRSGEISAGAYA